MGMAPLLQKEYPSLELNVVWMENWWRNSFGQNKSPGCFLRQTCQPDTVYPGMVLLEATNMSEGAVPPSFEIVGTYFRMREIKRSFKGEA